MKLKLNILALFVITNFFGMSAQTQMAADKLVSNVINEAKTVAIKSVFSVSSNNNGQQLGSNGNFIIKGTKFVIEMTNMKIQYDGKTQWTYLKNANELSISEPSAQELMDTNPMLILTKYFSNSSCKYASKALVNGNYQVVMLPKNKNDEVSRIEVQINKVTNNLVQIKVHKKNQGVSVVDLKTYQRDSNLKDSEFVFNKSKYKGLIVNDLR